MKKELISLFILGFLASAVWTYNFKDKFESGSEVLSSQTNITTPAKTSEIIATLSPTPTETASPVATVKPTPKPTTPQPTPTIAPTFTPTPPAGGTPTPLVKAPENLEPLFKEFADAYGVDANKLKSIADCESHFNNAVSAPPYAGMYQFTENTWMKYRKKMGKDPDINLRFGARESIETAAYVLSVGDLNIWPVCK